ncbi:hypothetical protein BFJ69_g17416 [Fusarium oxysporum]|uniref:Uncharacterized protein n=1 Tax=Fusarium oxysporum TaxID=5507 RepID=A0A420M8B3_FUSOX|nr:hypothetical protein BFJ69_g17416 [Fusarium oxysporum]
MANPRDSKQYVSIQVETGRSATRSRTSPNRTYSAAHNLVVRAEIGRVQFWMLTHTYSGRYRPYCHSGNQEWTYLTAETEPTAKAGAANLGRHEPAAYDQICRQGRNPHVTTSLYNADNRAYLHGALAPQAIYNRLTTRRRFMDGKYVLDSTTPSQHVPFSLVITFGRQTY